MNNMKYLEEGHRGKNEMGGCKNKQWILERNEEM